MCELPALIHALPEHQAQAVAVISESQGTGADADVCSAAIGSLYLLDLAVVAPVSWTWYAHSHASGLAKAFGPSQIQICRRECKQSNPSYSLLLLSLLCTLRMDVLAINVFRTETISHVKTVHRISRLVTAHVTTKTVLITVLTRTCTTSPLLLLLLLPLSITSFSRHVLLWLV